MDSGTVLSRKNRFGTTEGGSTRSAKGPTLRSGDQRGEPPGGSYSRIDSAVFMHGGVLGSSLAQWSLMGLDLPTVGTSIKVCMSRTKEFLMQFQIQKMTCGGCAKSVTRAIHLVDPEASVTADPVTRRVDVVSMAEATKIEQALSAAGYPPSK